ncbi:hypothetical protein Ct61P_12699 [Colletotrichum tofieldiae]|nr:hypothetical protein Ct61P_12699 [Colletotrichum tofieldiae]
MRFGSVVAFALLALGETGLCDRQESQSKLFSGSAAGRAAALVRPDVDMPSVQKRQISFENGGISIGGAGGLQLSGKGKGNGEGQASQPGGNVAGNRTANNNAGLTIGGVQLGVRSLLAEQGTAPLMHSWVRPTEARRTGTVLQMLNKEQQLLAKRLEKVSGQALEKERADLALTQVKLQRLNKDLVQILARLRRRPNARAKELKGKNLRERGNKHNLGKLLRDNPKPWKSPSSSRKMPA